MVPTPQHLLHAPNCCPSAARGASGASLRTLALALAAATIGWSLPAHAQDAPAEEGGKSQDSDQDSAQPSGSPAEEQREVAFEANELSYDTDNDLVTASGNVIMRSGEQSVRADQVNWDRKANTITATGNIRFVDGDGNVLYTDNLTLTDDLKVGAMKNMLLALREGGRLAANAGERAEDGTVILTQAAYSACAVEDDAGCPRTPSWRIVADRVIYDPEANRVRFKGAMLELFGARLLPIPRLEVATDGRAISGLMIPNLRVSPSNGVEISQSYYHRLSDSQDLSVTGYVYTEAPPMLGAQYRALVDKGAFQLTGYATRSARIPIGSETGTVTQQDWRGYFFGNGRFQLSPEWSVTASARVASDRTFLRRYDISRDDRLRSTFNVERITENSYLTIQGWATQTMRSGDSQGQVPIVLPMIDYRRRIDDPVLGGKVQLQLNSLAITRTNGQDTQRAFAGAQWDLRRVTSMGQEITLTALVRGDVYHSDQNELTSTVIYQGDPGWQARGVAVGAVDVKWPFVGEFLGGTQVLTPRVQVVASPPIRNLAVPNEDARAIDLEDSNLFALSRFPGYDRVEDGVRFTYGFDWQFTRPGLKIKTTIGQSYRLSEDPTLVPDGTGISERVSDFVGRTEVRYKDFLKVTHRFRLDKDNLAVRRNEFDLTIGSNRTYFEAGYLRLNRDISEEIEDLQDREELRVAGRVAFAKYWSAFGSAVINLTDRNEDPTLTSDGFEPLRTRLGFAYADDCLELGFTWRRDYVASGDARKGNTFQVHIALKNLGF
ncbi:LPS-assembly protein LptD [Altererythrobacter sp. CC-YST694]|uniref:LPS-assembly protein LptD n=1 Tax=Altererythrobacter sp. CC-YST694 TaxID=2755038 RepID=UPI001D022FD5|nr:LPS assembly protein LptD [Altererythrobacter sp. CC-YST694]MCB5424975.1 LPS-assembly protein LptD [Altererythrobacter sp. CC-YST694]